LQNSIVHLLRLFSAASLWRLNLRMVLYRERDLDRFSFFGLDLDFCDFDFCDLDLDRYLCNLPPFCSRPMPCSTKSTMRCFAAAVMVARKIPLPTMPRTLV
jgi:hypothetical protein